MRLRLIATGLLALLAACDKAVAPAAHATAILPTPANQAALDFVGRIAGDGVFEVHAAQIAAVRAKSPAVRVFAQRTAKDQTAAKAELDRAVAASGQTLPAPTELPDHLQTMLDQLSRGAAGDFDKTYVEQQIEADEDAVGLMEAYARDGRAPALKTAAGDLAPPVQARLQEARALEDALNKDP